jgi:hypothetical protein
MKLVLTIAAALVLTLASFIAFIPAILIIGIPTGILVGIGVVVFKSGVTAVGIAIFAIAGLIAAAALGCIYMLLIAPITVFFASYAFYFFGGRYPRLGALLWPQTPAPITPVPQMAGTQPVS